MVGRTKGRMISTVLLFLALAPSVRGQSSHLNEMSLERWGKLREVERHQMQVAEKYFRDRNWTVAADEYEKYMTLYESSNAASHALLKWAMCQVEMRHQNTAIDDGFRSVVDYWPDSEDAIAASFYVGKTLQDIGQTKKAKVALKEVADQHAKHLAGVHAMVSLAQIATIENDEQAIVENLRKLTFQATRDKLTRRQCETASIQLAAHLFGNSQSSDAIEALATTYQLDRLANEVVNQSRTALRTFTSDPKSTAKSAALADELIAYLREQEPESIETEQTKGFAKNLCYLVIDVQQTAKRNDQVLAEFSNIAKRFGSDDELLGRIANWYQANGQYEKARENYKKFADKIVGLTLIADSYRQEKNLTHAIQTYAKLIAADSENQSKWKALSATTYREFEKYAEAITLYQQLMQEDTTNGDRWLWETATTHREAGDWRAAIGFFRQSERFPDSYREMASCHRHLKQHSEAVTLYNQIAGGDKAAAPWAMLQIGYTEEEAKRKDQAIAAFKKVCKLFPKDQNASRAHAHLQNQYKLTVTLGGSKQD
ncbi:MAG: tetratricopeptide repeat protein [Rubripirellula sp.]|nr:tetratricopeptide repeat protein [Rubripirellula sp.]